MVGDRKSPQPVRDTIRVALDQKRGKRKKKNKEINTVYEDSIRYT